MNSSSIFCSSPIWNASLTWETASPDLTSCFYYFLMPICMLAYCILMFVPTSLHLIRIIRIQKGCQQEHSVQCTPVVLLRVLSSIIFSLLLIIDFATSLLEGNSGVEYRIHPGLLLGAMVSTYGMQFLEIRKRRSTSGASFIFWLLLLLHFALLLQSELRKKLLWRTWPQKLALLCAYCGLSALGLLSATLSSQSAGSVEKPCPERTANYLSRLSFWWMTGLILAGYKRPLTGEVLFRLNLRDACGSLFPRFKRAWNSCTAPRAASAGAGRLFDNRRGSNGAADGVELQRKSSERDAKEEQADTLLPARTARAGLDPILLKALAKMFAPTIMLSMVLKFFFDLLNFSGTMVLKAILQYLQSDTQYAWRGHFFVALMLCTGLVQTAILQQYFHIVFTLGMQIRTVLMSAVYKKSLKLSNKSRRSTTTGSIVNLMSVDAFNFQDLMSYVNILWSGPMQIAICIVLLYRELGPSIFAGVAVLIVVIPINGALASKMKKFQVDQMQLKDTRIKIISDILAGIRVIKLYAWEPAFAQQVGSVRKKEIDKMRHSALLSAAASFAWTCVPVLVSLVTFTVYSAVSADNVLDAEKCFVSISLFNLLRFPLSVLPMVITTAVECSVSLRRITDFLLLEELPKDAVLSRPDLDVAVRIEDGSFSWDASESSPTLADVELSFAEGSLVAVVGAVGCGKSSLLGALLGDIHRLRGRVQVKGSLAYVSQEPFIQNLSLRDNVLFNSPMDRARYERVVDCCALRRDLEILAAGDLTEIGEKGITLSGGQKARVALARACYADRDIYLLDDPLSAVDVHVGRHIFERVLSSDTGFLRRKTRVLVTHSLTYLPFVDRIVVLSDGRVSELGTFAELVKAEGPFSQLIQQFLASHHHDGDLRAAHCAGSDVKTVLNILDEIQKEEEEEKEEAVVVEQQQKAKLDTKEVDAKAKPQKPAEAAAKTIDEEKSKTGNVQWQVYLTYFRAVGLCFCVGVIAAFSVSHALSLGSNFWLADWTQDARRRNATAGGDLRWSRWQRIGILGVLSLLQSVSIFGGSFLCSVACLRASRSLHNGLLNRVLATTLAFFESTPLGRIVNRFGADIDCVDKNLAERLRSMLRILFWLIEAIIAICYSLPYFLLALPGIGALFFVIQRVFIRSSRQLKRLESTAKSPIFSHFSETLNGVTSIRAFEQQSVFKKICDERIDSFNLRYYPNISSNRWLAVRLEFVGTLILTFTCLFGVLARDSVPPGLVGLAAVYALNVTQSLNWLIRMTSELETNIVSVERIKEYSELEQEAPWHVDDEPELPDGWPLGAVSFRDFACRYRDDLPPAISGVCLDVAPGQRIGVVGRTGSGKSTLTLSLFRVLEPSAGSLSIDGVDIRGLGLHRLRRSITLIPQDPLLFAGSLRWNLDPFERHSDAEVWTALETAHLKAWTETLAEGLQHGIAEGGANLSLGQRQLLCLARALLRRSRLLVLDEATAAVDLRTDALIQDTIRSKFADATLITVAHRINTVVDYDVIVVLEAGRVLEFGHPQRLLADRSSAFRAMAAQAGLVQ